MMVGLDYAVMNGIGPCGRVTNETYSRFAREARHDIRHSKPYHVLLVRSGLSEYVEPQDDRVRKNIAVSVETFDAEGGWSSMRADGWSEVLQRGWAFKGIDHFSQKRRRLRFGYSSSDVESARAILQRYAERDSRLIAMVGFDRGNITDPRKLSEIVDRDRFSHGDRPAYRDGRLETDGRIRVLKHYASTFTIDDFDEAPLTLAREAHAFFLAMCEGIVEPHCLYDEFGNVVLELV